VTGKTKSQEQLQRNWSMLVDEFLKKPLRMVVAGLVVSVLTVGGNFLGQWFIKVINVNKRVTAIERTVATLATSDSLRTIKDEVYREQQRGRMDSLMIYVARIQGALSTEGIRVSRMSSLNRLMDTRNEERDSAASTSRNNNGR